MRKQMYWRILLTAAFVLCASISSASAQEKQFNTPNSVSAESIKSAFIAPVESAFIAPPQPGSILLLDGYGETGEEDGRVSLDKLGYTYTKASASELATVNLDAFNIIFISWNPFQEMIDALNARKIDLEKWISKGGGIVVNAEWKTDDVESPYGVTNPYSFLPVSFNTDDTDSISQQVQIIDTTHPLAEGLTDELLSNWETSVHGKITAPPTATVVSVATEFDSPHIVGMCYNKGKIVVVASDPEYHVAYGWPSNDGPAQLLYNELKWASIPCNQPPVANAGPNQSAVQGDTVCFDGSGSTDAENDPLTYLWTLISTPTGSTAVLDDDTAEKPCFTADLPGTYQVSLTVNDGTTNSAPSTAEATVLSCHDNALAKLQEAMAIIGGLPPTAFKTSNMQHGFVNQINTAILRVKRGKYAEALHLVRGGILVKTDGCAASGKPDKNDWLKDCADQETVYSLLMEAIECLQSMI